MKGGEIVISERGSAQALPLYTYTRAVGGHGLLWRGSATNPRKVLFFDADAEGWPRIE